MLKKIRNVARRVKKAILDEKSERSYAQLGEDLIIENLLKYLLDPERRATSGFYVDIGAFHPVDKSNTMKFYRSGSVGFVADIGEPKQTLFEKIRPRDTFINAAVVPDDFEAETVEFSKTDGYGSEVDHIVEKDIGIIANAERTTVEVAAMRISELLDRCMSSSASQEAKWRILSVDIEGMDERVIKSIDFNKFPFDIVCCEQFVDEKDSKGKVNALLEEPIHDWMVQSGYDLQGICGPSLIYLRKDSCRKRY